MEIVKKVFGLIMLIVSLIVVAPQVSEAQIYMGKDSAVVRWSYSDTAFFQECIKVMDMGFAPYSTPVATDKYGVFLLFHRVN